MFIAKWKLATTIVLGMGLLGIGWGLYPTRAATPPSEAKQEAAPPPPSTSREPDREGGNPSKVRQGEKKIALPRGPAPVQALVSLTKEGKLTVKCEHIVISKRRMAAPPLPGGQIPGPVALFRSVGGGIGAVAPADRPMELSYDLDEIQVFDTKGNEVDKKKLAKLLKDETVAVASFGDQPPDPLHLRILKEETLVFILPPPPAGGIPLPDENQVLLPGFGSLSLPDFYFTTQRFSLESKER